MEIYKEIIIEEDFESIRDEKFEGKSNFLLRLVHIQNFESFDLKKSNLIAELIF